ncbi:MAG: ABC transporter ATP-binding protein [Fimbriimonadaceae bacterium]|nr:MAG: ABC transporter ATP-binding protein [Fimbriimonadaceae bacterium]
MPPEPRTEALIQVRAVSKSYGAVRALDNVSVDFLSGEIHAVLGENGAGKSTLMGILSGFVSPDQGDILFDGSPLPTGRPIEIRQLGVKMVHQHFMLVPQFLVSENLALGEITGNLTPLSLAELSKLATGKGTELGWNVDLQKIVLELPVGAQQRIEILKALAGDSRVLILDEPTAVLSPDEIRDLFGVLRKLRHQGIAVILIAHKLSEIMAVADRVTVLRKGELIATSLIGDTNEVQLAEWMVGDVPEFAKDGERSFGEVLVKAEKLSVNDDRGVKVIDSVDFEILAGQIFGLGGVDGNGQIELAEALAGVRDYDGVLTLPDNVAYIPQDRQTDGLALGLSVAENLMLSGVPSECKWGLFIRPALVRDYAQRMIAEYEIKVGKETDTAKSLSGGNQQKIVVARNLAQNPDLIIAVNPTRGLDIRATDYVHRRLREAAERGAAVLLISTDLDELSALADETKYLQSGGINDQFLVANA